MKLPHLRSRKLKNAGCFSQRCDVFHLLLKLLYLVNELLNYLTGEWACQVKANSFCLKITVTLVSYTAREEQLSIYLVYGSTSSGNLACPEKIYCISAFHVCKNHSILSSKEGTSTNFLLQLIGNKNTYLMSEGNPWRGHICLMNVISFRAPQEIFTTMPMRLQAE